MTSAVLNTTRTAAIQSQTGPTLIGRGQLGRSRRSSRKPLSANT